MTHAKVMLFQSQFSILISYEKSCVFSIALPSSEKVGGFKMKFNAT